MDSDFADKLVSAAVQEEHDKLAAFQKDTRARHMLRCFS